MSNNSGNAAGATTKQTKQMPKEPAVGGATTKQAKQMPIEPAAPVQPPKEVGGTPIKRPPPKRTKADMKKTSPPEDSQTSDASQAFSASPSVFYRPAHESNLA